ncbi:Chaperone required for the assembly of the F1-ATPase [Cognatiyoonia koreensis]|uniref:Chaperone required for the assembly of the F1-ATPase n=1 Tax=Cognatiyoonia koreensis TaxID=364200 RepID=A0A1I0S074_9RHOB|nr:ATP12 family protein [Cognatiyoonia koreensis]SEW47348.1 Chaperone required for the assembly of the F1-ATPase [Cognatiyoonia koreensis]
MSEWAAKRFWKSAEVVPADDGFSVSLDGRMVKTPAKAALIVPTQRMADAIAIEWDAQTDKINPQSMPVTRGANAAIDKVAHQKAEVVEMLAAYGDSDLLCYRAAGPDALIGLQCQAWDPLLDWAATELRAPLVSAEGVMHVPQDPVVLDRLTQEVAAQTPFQLAGFHDLVSLSGSLVLSLAVIREHLSPDQAWAVSRVDEEYQISQWGADDEATDLAETKRAAFVQAADFFRMCLT